MAYEDTYKKYNEVRVGSGAIANALDNHIPNSCSNMYMHKKAAAETKSAVVNIKTINEGINRHWESMPEEARKFIFEKMDTLSIHKLAKFWSRPSVKQYTVGGMAYTVCSASWFMASQYLKLGHVREARALTLNGAFLQQCFVSIHLLLAVLMLFFTHIMCLHTPHASLSRTRQLK